MLIAFGITATFRPCLIEPAAPLPEDEAPAALLLEEEDDELPHAASATAAASTGIQRMPLMRMGASPCRRSGDELDAGEGRAGRTGGREEPCGRWVGQVVFRSSGGGRLRRVDIFVPTAAAMTEAR